MKKLPLVLILSIFPCFCIWPHGLIRFVTTPFTPSIELIWVLPINLSLFIIINIFLFVFLFKKKILKSILKIIVFVLIFISILIIIIFISIPFSHGYIPTINVPAPTFWGLPWHENFVPFLFWNIFILGLFIIGLRIIVKDKRPKLKFILVIINILLFFICLLPFIIVGAFAHGYEGGYVTDACSRNINIINEALILYAIDNNGDLPDGKSIDEIIVKISSYIPDKYYSNDSYFLFCPLESAYTKTPKKYIWNHKYSGINISDFSSIYGFPFQCTYHQGVFRYNYDIDRLWIELLQKYKL